MNTSKVTRSGQRIEFLNSASDGNLVAGALAVLERRDNSNERGLQQ